MSNIILFILANINWPSVIIVTILSFGLSALWHSKFLFGKIWVRENNIEKNTKINIPVIFGATAVAHLVALAALSALVSGQGAAFGLIIGFIISFVWILPAMLGTYLFANRSMKLLAIDAGMYIVLFSLAGLVLGIW